MKRLIGFIMFWIAIGMLLMLFIRHGLMALIIILLLLVCGYHLFCN